MRIKRYSLLILVFILAGKLASAKKYNELFPHFTLLEDTSKAWHWEQNGYSFDWNLIDDIAILTKITNKKTIWKGGLLPAFWLKTKEGKKQYIKAQLRKIKHFDKNKFTANLKIGQIGLGEIELEAGEFGIQFKSFKVNWTKEVPKIIELYYGTALLNEEEKARVPSLEFPFWANWEAEGFCVPSAKGAPIQSFFRRWDFGHASLPLGSFGPSLGTPYVAAYPRPIYSLSMGGNDGWIVIGAGSVPDAAMVLKIQSSNGCLQYLYREDLWGASPNKSRTWNNPLRITWALSAYDGFHQYFSSFGKEEIVSAVHQRNVWNSWGDFKTNDFNLKAIADKAHDFKADVVVIDDLWETTNGSGRWDANRFPDYEADLKYIRNKGLKTGYWQNVVWIQKPEEFNLTSKDLLCGIDGRPIKTIWNMNPHENRAYFCLDPSSPETIKMIRDRTHKIMKDLMPEMLKLDFGYGIPSPNVSTARNPAIRGEMLAFTLLKTVADAAREINPEVTIQYYSIHPLMKSIQNLVALDDLGDAGNKEADGHGQWSIWSSLAAAQGTAIMASSGYDWNSDTEVLLNTAIIGAQGAVLPRTLENNTPVPDKLINKRLALAIWHRHTVGWQPLWLKSEKGSLKEKPTVRCWGRLEKKDGKNILTALALREDKKDLLKKEEINNIIWNGRWAIISQDNQDIFASKKVVCIPFDIGNLIMPMDNKPARVIAVYKNREETIEFIWKDNALHLDITDHKSVENIVGIMVLRD